MSDSFVVSVGPRQIRANGYFAQEVYADGPHGAKFRFCGDYRCAPDKVNVTQDMLGAYWCHVGEFPGFQMLECQ